MAKRRQMLVLHFWRSTVQAVGYGRTRLCVARWRCSSGWAEWRRRLPEWWYFWKPILVRGRLGCSREDWWVFSHAPRLSRPGCERFSWRRWPRSCRWTGLLFQQQPNWRSNRGRVDPVPVQAAWWRSWRKRLLDVDVCASWRRVTKPARNVGFSFSFSQWPTWHSAWNRLGAGGRRTSDLMVNNSHMHRTPFCGCSKGR